MNNETLEKVGKLEKQRKLLFMAAPLCGLMATLKYLGVFAIGVFPPYMEGGLAVYCLVAGMYLTGKLKKMKIES